MPRRPQARKPEWGERAVQMVADVRASFASEQEAINAVAGILGIDPGGLREYVRQAEPGPGSPKQDTRELRPWRRLLFRSHTIMIGSVITVIGGLGLAYSQQLFGIGQPTPSPPRPNLEVDQVTLSYGDWPGKIPDPFRVDVKLLNSGTRLAAINDARLVIQRSIVLPQCAAGEERFPMTGFYPASLPISPKPGDTVQIPVSQLVPADGADRFELLLRTQLPAGSNTRPPVYLYRIHLYLNYNAGNQVLDAGEILVGFPFAPVPGQYFWPRPWAANPSTFYSLMGNNKHIESRVRACDIKASRELHAFLSSSPRGVKLPGAMAGIASQLAY